MKKYLLLILFFPNIISATIVNKVVASIGSIAITTYDIQMLRDFDAIATGERSTPNESLTKLITMSSLLVLSESSPEYYMDESELRKQINNITNNPSDPVSKQREELYKKFSSIYRMVLRSDKVKRGLMYSNIEIKNHISQPIPINESQSFYHKNKKQFKDSPFPKIDLIIFAVESSSKWGLSELESIEKQMAELAIDLDTSSDYRALKRKYSKLRFASYSGRTGLYTPDILILQKKVPDEIIGVSLQKVLNLGIHTITIQENKGIYIPQPIPFRSTGVPTYVTLKIMNIIQPKQLSFEASLPRIEEILRYQRAEKAIDKMIREQIKEGQLTLTPVDNKYQRVFRSFQ